MENRTFIMGDIHGMYDKLIVCLQAVSFDYTKDTLIQLGDVVDRGPDSYLVVEELLKIKNLIAIRGNHDVCFYDSIRTGQNNLLFNQGGKETLESYIKNCNPEREIAFKMSGYVTNFDLDDYPKSHVDFFKNQLPYYIDNNNCCFVHGGFNRHLPIAEQREESDLWWDRDLWLAARSYAQMEDNVHRFKVKDGFNEIFIGHTPTTYFSSNIPLKAANITNLDTGCGKGGLLTIMNLETREIQQA